jgi:hypothetical protein
MIRTSFRSFSCAFTMENVLDTVDLKHPDEIDLFCAMHLGRQRGRFPCSRLAVSQKIGDIDSMADLNRPFREDLKRHCTISQLRLSTGPVHGWTDSSTASVTATEWRESSSPARGGSHSASRHRSDALRAARSAGLVEAGSCEIWQLPKL